jgi:hypothetical protein
VAFVLVFDLEHVLLSSKKKKSLNRQMSVSMNHHRAAVGANHPLDIQPQQTNKAYVGVLFSVCLFGVVSLFLNLFLSKMVGIFAGAFPNLLRTLLRTAE